MLCMTNLSAQNGTVSQSTYGCKSPLLRKSSVQEGSRPSRFLGHFTVSIRLILPEGGDDDSPDNTQAQEGSAQGERHVMERASSRVAASVTRLCPENNRYTLHSPQDTKRGEYANP